MKFSLPQWRLPTSGPSVGLVIRSASVELLSLEGKKIAARASVPLDGQSPAHLTAAVRKACEAAGITPKRAAVSILMPDVLLRFFTIPVVPRAEWEAAAQFEARKYLPFKTDELMWDAHVTPSKTAGKLDVIFAAIKRDAFAPIETALANAGVSPALIEPSSASLARLTASGLGHPAGDFVCLVDAQAGGAYLVIARDGIPYLARDVSFTAQPAAPDAGSADARAQRLLSELAVSFDFFTREYASAGITKIWLVGEPSLVESWCRWLTDQLRCPVEPGASLVSPFVDGELPLAFASAVGVLQSARSRRGASIDFLKRATGKPSAPAMPVIKAASALTDIVSSVKTSRAAVFAGCLAGVLLCAWLVGAQSLGSKRRHLQQLRTAVAPARWGLDGMTKEELEAAAARLTPQLALLKQLMDARVSVAGKLDALARLLPDGIWLTGLSYGEDRKSGQPHVSLKGACFLGSDGNELDAIQELEDRMKRSPAFFNGFSASRLQEVTAQYDRQQDYTYRVFQLECS